MEHKEDGFRYTYSAERQEEIEAIRRKYLPREEDKLEQLRRLHNSAVRRARGAAISLGVIGALLLGTGMSLIMTELGALLGNWALGTGILVGLFGMGLVALAYPVYDRTLRRERGRIAPEILRLTEDLLQNPNYTIQRDP